MTVLYGAPLSPFVRKTMLALAHKGVEYDQVIVSPANRTEDFFRISPLGKIPAYKDDRITLCDSTVICEYLEEKYPCLLYTSPSPRNKRQSRMPSSA